MPTPPPTTPRGSPELAESQALPEQTVNEQCRRNEGGANYMTIADRVTAPPGSCVDGAQYLIIATATGAFTGKEGQVAQAVGTNAASGWLYRTLGTLDEGLLAYVQDEDTEYRWSGSAFAVNAGGGVVVPVKTMTASEDISAGMFVNIHNSSGGKIRKANATDNTKRADAYAPAAISSAGTGSVYGPGSLISGLSGMTPGADVYLDTTGGGWTHTAPSSGGNLVQFLGRAVSATELFFNPDRGVTL